MTLLDGDLFGTHRVRSSHGMLGSHFIVKWDAAKCRFVCDCGEPFETATDFEWHKLRAAER